MSNPESTRNGWIFRGIGVFFVVLAIGLTAWDLTIGSPIWPVNIITLTAGIVNFYLGSMQIRRAREHHRFMEDHRAEMERLAGWRKQGMS